MYLIYKSICVNLIYIHRKCSQRMVMYTLNISKRDLMTKNQELRDQGIVPGMIYGPNIENMAIRTSEHELRNALHTKGEVYEVKAKRRKVYVKIDEIQRDPVSKQFIHFSLVELPKGETNEVEVPIVLKGEPEGRRKGGVMVLMHENLTLSGTPKSMPAQIVVDISMVDIADKVTIGDIKLPKGIEVKMDLDEVVATCRPPAKESDLISDQVEEDTPNESSL